MGDTLLDALRRSVAARNSDPARMARWLDDFAERAEAGRGKEDEDDGYQADSV